jgi:hypothetical protein
MIANKVAGGFVVGIVANGLMIMWAAPLGYTWVVGMAVGFATINLFGIYKWTREEEEKW